MYWFHCKIVFDSQRNLSKSQLNFNLNQITYNQFIQNKINDKLLMKTINYAWSGLGGNKVGVEHYMPFLTALLQTCGESTLDRTFLWVHYKKHNNYGLHFNGTNISCILAIFLSLAAKLKKKKTFWPLFMDGVQLSQG